MNLIQRTTRNIIKHSFHFSVWTIEQFSDVNAQQQQVQQLQTLPQGTLGKDIADCLQRNKLRLVPNFESHDLKHVLLGYHMTPEDEIRLQAFMLGNGNLSIASVAIFLFGALLLPELWFTFIRDFINGYHATPIKTWTIEEYAHCNTLALRRSVLNNACKTEPAFNMNAFVKLGAFTAIVLGAFGMLFCLPFLFSNNVADLAGAGFPFVAGAIMASAGLISLSNQNKQLKPAVSLS